MLAKVLPVVVTVYELHALRIDAIAAQNSTTIIPGRLNPPANIDFIPPYELCPANERAQLLRNVDDLIQYYCSALESGALVSTSPSLGHIVDFAYQIVSHHGPEQR